mmetsp:Transcript_47758/g.126658  ORF Transcript_47758/g.126658 Transcript_47758/m.126658 type:complete len:297 (-) Transcript_47758:501-1391(-)
MNRRARIPIKDLLQSAEVKKKVDEAKLQEIEVICPRLYTGPMFTLYNAALRGFPPKAVTWLQLSDTEPAGLNKYETTIFAISSGIMKLSKVTAIPAGRKLYRGLAGMVLPDQFWKSFSECHLTIKVSVDHKSASSERVDRESASSERSDDPNVGTEQVDQALHRTNAILNKCIQTMSREVGFFGTSFKVDQFVIGDGETVPTWMRRASIVSPPTKGPECITFKISLPVSADKSNQECQGQLTTILYSKFENAQGNGVLLNVSIDAISQKPSDFRGGGASLFPTLSLIPSSNAILAG